jgi:predicted alpha/beta-fold hydrolase
VQTVVASRLSKKPPVTYRRAVWESPDQDVLAVDTVDADPVEDTSHGMHNSKQTASRPEAIHLVLCHGLEGSAQSHYSLAIMHEASRLGWGASVVHFRGCGGLKNRKPRAYHSGDSQEIDWILRRFRRQHAGLLFVAGISLGANALLKWLGEQGEAASGVIDASVGICPPQDLRAGAYALASGLNLMYMRYFLHSLIPNALERLERFPGLYDRQSIINAKTFIEFDEYVTAPLHGFKSAEHYWASSSCGPWLAAIRSPCLVVNPLNDPFVPAHSLRNPYGLHRNLQLVYPRDGGHVGFIEGGMPASIAWMPRAICQWFKSTVYG